jgi:hypothetical protein
MNQVAFHFAPSLAVPADAVAAADTPVAAAPSAARGTPAGEVDPGDALGFDHARYGLVPPADCLWPGHPVREGWERGRRLVGRRTRPASLAVGRWLGLRLAAWRAGAPFDDVQITPTTLRALEASTRCPVTGTALDASARVMRLDPMRGWIAGNLALVAAPVAERLDAMSWLDATAALQAAERAAQDDAAGRPSMRDAGAFTLAQWRRAVALKSLATPLAEGEARAQAMRVLPPTRVRLVNPIQAVQALLSLQLATPGWGARSSRVAASIPLLLRCEFHLFFHTLLAHTLRAGQSVAADDERTAMRVAVERAWSEPTVQRRWERFARRIDAALAETLVERLAAEPLPGLQTLSHPAGLVLDA